MKLLFITTNKHKFQEVADVLKEYNIEIEQKTIDYPEDKDDEMDQVAKKAAKNLAEELGQPVIVEDTGLYFNAYNNFPGAMPKYVINGIGFDGIFRLLKDKDRTAYFKTVIGYCQPGQEPKTFEAELHGTITEEVVDPDADTMPYNHIFIADGQTKATSQLSLKEFNQISHRAKCTRKLGQYLTKK